MEPAALAFLTAQRENMRAMLLLLALVPDDRRDHMKHSCVQLLGALEDTLGVERTFPPRQERRRARDLQRVVE